MEKVTCRGARRWCLSSGLVPEVEPIRGTRAHGHATCCRICRWIALLTVSTEVAVAVRCQWHRGADNVCTLFPPSIGVTHAAAKLCSPSPLLSPTSDDTGLPIRLTLPTPHARFHQACLPRLKSPSLFLTPFPSHALDCSYTIQTLLDKCTSGSFFHTSNTDQNEPGAILNLYLHPGSRTAGLW